MEKLDDPFGLFQQFQPAYISAVFADFFDSKESIADRVNPGQQWRRMVVGEYLSQLAGSIHARAYLKASKNSQRALVINQQDMHTFETEILLIIKAMNEQGFFNFSFIDGFVR